MMYTYMETKAKAIETLLHGVTALSLAEDHEACRKIARTMIKTLELTIITEDGQEAFEKGDIAGAINALSKSFEVMKT